MCICHAGMKWNEWKRSCEDVNECETITDPCYNAIGTECVNTEGRDLIYSSSWSMKRDFILLNNRKTLLVLEPDL